MALIATSKLWVGLSTDTKPTGVAIGSRFYEYNTKRMFLTYDGTNWTRAGK